MTSLAGLKALVTGGTRGIGAAVAKRLYQEGAEVTITGRRRGRLAPAGCSFEAVDFADRRKVRAFAGRLAKTRIDILVNNAGINKIADFSRITDQDYDRVQEVNTRAPLVLCRAVLPGMRRRGWGRIINITSIFSIVSKERRAAYSASKFALDGLTAALAAEVAADGVLANCVAPGFIDTDLTRKILGPAGMRKIAKTIPARRLGHPREIAAFVTWLAGPDNTYISGQNIVIDGGFSRV